MNRCRACGAPVDGDVCDSRCETRLLEEQYARADRALVDAGQVRCDDCGETMPAPANDEPAVCPDCAVVVELL